MLQKREAACPLFAAGERPGLISWGLVAVILGIHWSRCAAGTFPTRWRQALLSKVAKQEDVSGQIVCIQILKSNRHGLWDVGGLQPEAGQSSLCLSVAPVAL
jgi:hypothetical protein